MCITTHSFACVLTFHHAPAQVKHFNPDQEKDKKNLISPKV